MFKVVKSIDVDYLTRRCVDDMWELGDSWFSFCVCCFVLYRVIYILSSGLYVYMYVAYSWHINCWNYYVDSAHFQFCTLCEIELHSPPWVPHICTVHTPYSSLFVPTYIRTCSVTNQQDKKHAYMPIPLYMCTEYICTDYETNSSNPPPQHQILVCV